ncbi:MAG: DUF3971 domain-containing protein [Gammaproteobacteria bacterium]|nr:DUF3971 domain-containing protein [Gammaproteobacteria bacterium]
MKKGWHSVIHYLGYSLAALIILAAFSVSVTRLLSPILDDDRQRFEKIVGDILQRPVAIEHIHIAWDFLQPTLSLTNVIVFDPVKKRTILHVDQFKISPAIFRSFFTWHLVPNNITISGIKLAIQQQKDGSYQINGSPMDASTGTSSWMFAHPDFLLKEVDLRFTTNHDQTYVTHLGRLNLNASWNGQSGEFDLNGKDVSVTLNQIFSDPLQLDKVKGVFQIKKLLNQDWQIQVKHLKAENDDVSLSTDAIFLLSEKDSPTIDLTGQFSVFNAARITRYLPIKIFDPDLTHWLEDAFLSGGLKSGEATIHGKLADFPFDKGGGVFLIQGQVQDIDLHVADGWPTLQKLNGKLIFSGSAMNATIETGEVSGANLHAIEASIPDMGADKAQLIVKGKVDGTLTQALRFIHRSPLKMKLGDYFSLLDPSGPMQMNLNMTMPLSKPDDVRLLGKMQMANAIFDLSRWHVSFDHMTGDASFSEEGLLSANISGMLFDKPMTLTIARKIKNEPAQVQLKSEISIAQLQKWLGISLQNYAQGSAPFAARFALPKTPAQFQVNVQSNLSGVAIHLAGLFEKNVNDVLNTQIQFNVVSGKGIISSEVIVDAPKQESLLSGKTSVKISTVSDDHKIDIDNENVNGSLLVPIDDISNGVHAKLNYLHLFPKNNSSQKIDPRQLPPLTFSADDVQYGDIHLGQVEFTLLPRNNGVQIRELDVHAPFGRLNASGNWLVSRSDLKGDLNTDDTDRLLASFGNPVPNFEAGESTVHFQLSWPGAPWQLGLATLSGDVFVKVGKGHIINLDSSTNAQVGLARMLNIFSLQSIPRRLSLDFSDLAEKGYSFDSIKGDFNIRMGDAFTRNTYFKSVVADVAVSGRIGFVTKDFDVRLAVTPHVTASLPVVATIAVNPLAGIAAWLVEKAVTPEVSKIASYHYIITGPWAHPTWVKSDNPGRAENHFRHRSLKWNMQS